MLKNYIWEIFELAEAHDTPVDIGVDMLVTNLENREGSFFYEGADGMDYDTARAKWETLTPAEKTEAKNEAGKLIREKYEALCGAFREKDKAAFLAALE